MPGNRIANVKIVLNGLQDATPNSITSNTDKIIDVINMTSAQYQYSERHARPLNPT